MRIISLIFLSLLISSSLKSQYGFVEASIIKKNGDTLVCQLERAYSYGGFVTYRLFDAAPIQQLESTEIKTIKTDHFTFENVPYKKKEKLMKLEINEPIKLYSYTTMVETERHVTSVGSNSALKMGTTYLINFDNNYIALTNKNFKEVLQKLFVKCNSGSLDSFTYADIPMLVIHINTCK